MQFAFQYTCQTCGCSFGSNSLNARYCTRRCRDKKQRERRKELDNLRAFDNLAQNPSSGHLGHRSASASALPGALPDTSPDTLPPDLSSSTILQELGFTTAPEPSDDAFKNETPAGKEPNNV